MENLIDRLRRMGLLFLIGFLVIIYFALGFLYFQQGTKQTELEEQIAKLNITVSKKLPSNEKMLAEYDEINDSLSPMSVETALDIIVGIASESGIDVALDGDKFRIPPTTIREEKVGNGSYQVLSFKSIHVQGSDDSVMAFISVLDSGETLKTMVLKRVAIHQVEIKIESEGEEEETITETVASLDVDIYTKSEGVSP